MGLIAVAQDNLHFPQVRTRKSSGRLYLREELRSFCLGFTTVDGEEVIMRIRVRVPDIWPIAPETGREHFSGGEYILRGQSLIL